MVEAASATPPTPINITMTANARPAAVCGGRSPYPTVVSVCTVTYKLSESGQPSIRVKPTVPKTTASTSAISALRMRKSARNLWVTGKGIGQGNARPPIPSVNAWATKTSFTLPTDAVFSVFEYDAELHELIANLVGALEVATVTRFLPLINQLLDFFIEYFWCRVAKDSKHGVETIYRRQYFAPIIFAKPAPRDPCVHFAR